MNSLRERRRTAMEKLMAIGTARRGQLSEQYCERKDRNGKVRRTGPYYVWQQWVQGQKRSMRVPVSALSQVRADLERGREVQSIFNELWAVMEQTAVARDADSKKKPGRHKQLSAGKSRGS
ncbi:MAG: hypothetical protein QME60_05290 [Verrucomicrobiota bacterium]|nr:hypothetical protein [Verrucomicrobiota bacterium]